MLYIYVFAAMVHARFRHKSRDTIKGVLSDGFKRQFALSERESDG